MPITWKRFQSIPQPFRQRTTCWNPPHWQSRSECLWFYTYHDRLIIGKHFYYGMILNSILAAISNWTSLSSFTCWGFISGTVKRRGWSLSFRFIFDALYKVIAFAWSFTTFSSSTLSLIPLPAWLSRIYVSNVWLSLCFSGSRLMMMWGFSLVFYLGPDYY